MFVAGQSLGDTPLIQGSSALRTNYGQIQNPVGRVVAYVGTALDCLSQDQLEKLVPTLAAALPRCKAGCGDVIYILPGHAENVTSATALAGLVANTKIIGLGEGRERGTFTWTVAAASWAVTVANVKIQNLILNMEGGTTGTTTTAPLTLTSATGFKLIGCDIRMATDASNKVAIGITVTTSSFVEILANRIFGATAGEVTTAIRVVGSNNLRLVGNDIEVATSATAVGVVQFLTTLSSFVFSESNVYRNNKAASTSAVVGMAGVEGVARYDQLCILANALLIGWTTGASMQFHRCTICNELNESGAEGVVAISA